jgi:hypothetical protein
LNRLALVAVLAVLAVLLAPMRAHASAAPGNAFTVNGTFYGVTVYHVESSTPANTSVSLFSGSGLLFGVACSSGASGEFGIAFDSASAGGLTTATLGKAVSPRVLASADGVTTCTSPTCSPWAPNFRSIRLQNGLAFIKNGTYDSCQVYALSDAEVLGGAH